MKLVVMSLVAAVAGQAPPTTPTWFLKTGLQGGFTERSAECGQISGSVTEAGNGPIVIPESEPADICINFPPRPDANLKGGWRHDRGVKGDCTDGCCDFLPPTKKARAPKVHPTWFQTEGDCSNTAAAITGPIYLQGEDSEERTLCIQVSAEGEFAVHRGVMGNCRGRCCIYYGKREE